MGKSQKILLSWCLDLASGKVPKILASRTLNHTMGITQISVYSDKNKIKAREVPESIARRAIIKALHILHMQMPLSELQTTLFKNSNNSNNINKKRGVPERIARWAIIKALHILHMQMPLSELQATLLKNSIKKLQAWDYTDSKARSVRTQTLLPLLFPTEWILTLTFSIPN